MKKHTKPKITPEQNEKNEKNAFDLFKQAANKGNDQAMNFLGIYYENGYGVPKNKEKALKWYKKAKDSGSKRAIGEYNYLKRKLDNADDDIENEEKHKILISADEIIDQDDEDKMHLLTNFTIEEFEELFNTIAPILETRVHKDALISPRSKLLLTLCWCKHGETFQLLSSNFGLKLTYTHDVIINVIQRAGKVLSQKYIKWISVNQRITDFNMRLLDWPMLLGSVDATIQ